MSNLYKSPPEVDDDNAGQDPPSNRPYTTTIVAGVFVVIGVVEIASGELANGLGALMLAFSIWSIGVMVRGRKKSG
ncbi:hypothetical protein [Aporhodopirellula aestuarii]|uniref:Uncharacterized protein n=1 Tax=Aporhodopirellula aestuarii TaxID=2950107 RepID=A0ABT0U3T4_9BACT|nr:hypothetical protein [Aporhodopirellula aestuarii]MCM2371547.1 hypothetical protein [Aporhodopirellula aestuarii]